MKLISINLFILMFTLSAGHIALGQADTTSNKDNIRYIEPEVVDASLDMIVAPEGYIVSEQFNGYIHFQTSSAIILTLIKDVTYMNLAKGMNEDFFKKNSLTLVKETKMTSDFGVKGIIYKFSFVLEGISFVRYTVYAGDLNKTLWLAITYPEKVEDLIEGELLKSIQSINLNPKRNEE